ncbi:M3 family metallopeptidase [Pseudomonas fragi]|uniref:M3 family metallopeptidase n=1 Tax=Pseudomonas fragi TaxID=296 RepID=UPI001472FF1A|nr:M3 family metallopeptidase [Pseudomonas fragi]MBM1204695.1 M3 family metallopeptidase [Pseudomonas fragi]NNB06196.1 M3 family metallopeptidase [Pseudomonas fragi]
MEPTNPLLSTTLLPLYSEVRLEHLKPAIEHIVADNLQTISRIVATQSRHPTWSGLILPMETLTARLDDAIGVIMTLGQVSRDVPWETTIGDCFRAAHDYKTQVLQDRGLYLACKALAHSPEALELDRAQQALLHKILLDYRLAGSELPAADRGELARLNREISRLEWVFFENARQSRKAWRRLVHDESLLAGLPAALKAQLAQAARAAGLEGWLITLDERATYTEIMSCCQNRALREELFTAYNTRASELGPAGGQYDNGPVLNDLLSLRHQKALLLGYGNHAELSIQNKAASTDTVLGMLRTRIAQKSARFATQTAALHALAATLGYDRLQPWDLLFLARRHGRQPGALSNDQLRAWFPFNRVFEGIVLVVKRLFAVDLVEQTSFNTWHPDVRLFEVNEAGVLLGHLFIDPYMRAPKINGCWMQSARSRRVNAQGELTTPVAIVYGNFTPEAEGAPALLTHVQMGTLFHELGHCLKLLLTRSPYSAFSRVDSLGSVASRFAGKCAEQWCWSRDSLRWYARHHQHDSELTYEQVDQALSARDTERWLEEVQELSRSLFDFELHLTWGDGRSVEAVWRSAQNQVQPLPQAEHERFANTFDYMVAGHDANYYLREQAAALAEQVFARFEQEGVFSQQAGMAYREAFHAPGSEYPLSESFALFMGRPPAGI